MTEFLNNGAVAVGIGSALFDKNLIDNRDFDQITEIARQYVEKFNEVKA